MDNHLKSFLEYFEEDIRYSDKRTSDHYMISRARFISWCTILDAVEKQSLSIKELKSFMLGIILGGIIVAFLSALGF